MAVAVRLLDLPRIHPLLLWEPILPATCGVFRQRGLEPLFYFVFRVRDVYGSIGISRINRENPCLQLLPREATRRHFLAAAHLELVLAHDYEAAGEPDLALRSRISSTSCLWSGGEVEQWRQALEMLQRQYPAQTKAIQEVIAELTRDYPPPGR